MAVFNIALFSSILHLSRPICSLTAIFLLDTIRYSHVFFFLFSLSAFFLSFCFVLLKMFGLEHIFSEEAQVEMRRCLDATYVNPRSPSRNAEVSWRSLRQPQRERERERERERTTVPIIPAHCRRIVLEETDLRNSTQGLARNARGPCLTVVLNRIWERGFLPSSAIWFSNCSRCCFSSWTPVPMFDQSTVHIPLHCHRIVLEETDLGNSTLGFDKFFDHFLEAISAFQRFWSVFLF